MNINGRIPSTILICGQVCGGIVLIIDCCERAQLAVRDVTSGKTDHGCKKKKAGQEVSQ